MAGERVRRKHCAMDTMTLPLHTRHASPFTDERPGPGGRGTGTQVSPSWHELTQAAVVMAWTRDPDVMCDLVATLMDIHLRHCNTRSAERTLDELHLMIALELQELSGEPDPA